MRQDFYSVLGVPPNASADEIRQAYRQRARQFHPDASPGDPSAADYFKVINEAYKVLGTPQLRAAYDRALSIVSPLNSGAMGSQQHSQVHIPVAPSGLPQQNPSARARVTMSPDFTASPRASAPAVALRYTPAQASVMQPRELTRFYVLGELGAVRDNAVIEPLPLDLALVIDRSNTMRGAKIYETKQAVRNVLDQLHVDDLLTLVFFDDRAEVIADGETVQGRAGIEAALDNLAVKGATSIGSALSATLERLATRQNRTRVASLVLLTDGQTVGDEARCIELASYARDMGISITALGLELDWNRELLDRLAAISGGSSNFVERAVDVQPVFEDVIARLRATLAAGMRMIFEPAPGVRVLRGTRVSPDIAEGFSQPTDALTGPSQTATAALDLGALVGRPDIETAAVVWEVLLDPAALVVQNGVANIGKLSAVYWAPQQGGAHMQHLEQQVQVPINTRGEQVPIHPDVRLALELITAYRLQAQADQLKATGQAAEAVKRMNTAALRLKEAGSHDLATDALQAAKELAGNAPNQGVTETLRAKYGTKNMGVFHRLRRRSHAQ